MVILAVEFNQLGIEVTAHTLARFANHLNGPFAEDITPVFCDKYQVNMKQTDDGSSSAVVCAFPFARHIKTKYN